MRGKDLLNNISNVDDDLLAEAEASMIVSKKRHNWRKWIAVAACFFIVASVGTGAWRMGLFDDKGDNHSGNNSDSSSVAHSDEYRVRTDAVNLPENISDNVKADMIGCLVYKGKVYRQAASYDSSDSGFELVKKIVGEYVGDARGTLDDWSSQSDFATEFASTYYGPVYNVKGYSEDFRLYILVENGDKSWIQFLENYDDIGLNTGADFFGERMHLKNNVESISYLTHYDYNEGNPSNYKPLTSVSIEQFGSFLDELYNSPFERIDYKDHPDFYEGKIQGHLYLKMKDGTCVGLRLIEGGYVGYEHLGWVFVKMPGDNFDLLFSAVK